MKPETKSRIEKLPKWAQDVIGGLQQEIQDAKTDELVKLAFRFTPEVPCDLPPPVGNGLTKGWNFNTHTKTVYKQCSSSVHHGDGWEGTSSQWPRELYSNETLAWQALRHELEIEYSKALAAIDFKIEASRRLPTGS